jgi:hypothetical protein
MSQCYVCLEACSSTSPCECEIVVHENCLKNVCLKLQQKDCTVCRSPIRVEYINVEIDPPNILEMHEAITLYENNCCVCMCMHVSLFLIYLLSGLVGKFFLFFLGYKVNLVCFWCMDHVLSSLLVIFISFIVSHIFCKN